MKPVINRARTEGSALPATRSYRIRKSFAVVHQEQTGKGRIVFLPKGGELRVVGWSPCLGEGIEVEYETQLYSIFKADLLGPWSNPIESSQKIQRHAVRAIPARGACA